MQHCYIVFHFICGSLTLFSVWEMGYPLEWDDIRTTILMLNGLEIMCEICNVHTTADKLRYSISTVLGETRKEWLLPIPGCLIFTGISMVYSFLVGKPIGKETGISE